MSLERIDKLDRIDTFEHLQSLQPDGYLRVDVIDSGIGISEQNIQKLFQNFGKLKDSNGMNENGCGLGLTIC